MNLSRSIALGLACTGLAFSAFNDCKFNYGRQWDKTFNASTSFSGQGLTHLAIWLGDNSFYNTGWEGNMVTAAKANNLTPVIYAYVIAEVGKESNWSDCDTDRDNANLCTHGANLIRNNWSSILSRYGAYAQGIATDFGTSNTTIWLIEPDFLQYSVTGDAVHTNDAQNGGGIPDAELAGTYFNQIVAKIKQSLPNAKIAVDISPWLNSGITAWYNNFDKSKVDYLFTSGGRTDGNTDRIRSDNNNNLTWAQASAAMGGKKIIADDGYGVGGSSTTDYVEWMNTANIASRVANGVIGITIQEPASSFTTFAAANANINTCGTGTSSAAPISSSIVTTPSSSSNTVITPSSSSNAIVVPSSSSNAIITPSSSSNVVITPSSSSGTPVSDGSWTGVNTKITSPTTTGASIGVGSAWTDARTVTKLLGTVTAGTAYTLTFIAEVSRGGQSMDVGISLGSYCNQTATVTAFQSTVTCTFTATTTGDVVLSLNIPSARWETLTISELSLAGPNGNVRTIGKQYVMNNAQIHLRNGSMQNWLVPANASFEVFNLMGKRVYTQAKSPLSLSALPLGIYMIRARSGSLTVMKKVQNF